MHTNFSDGKLELAEVIDIYGSRGFGAIAITDHIAEEKTLIGSVAQKLGQVLTRRSFPQYKKALEAETVRAWDQYKMIVLTGFELSKNSISNSRSAHVLGIGISDYLPADGDPITLSKAIRAQGGIAIAAHPVFTRKWEKQTYHLWDRRQELASYFDAWEVASGPYLFEEVRQAKLPKIASSDLHIRRQLKAWKTKLSCERHPEAILESIRKQKLDIEYYPHSA